MKTITFKKIIHVTSAMLILSQCAAMQSKEIDVYAQQERTMNYVDGAEESSQESSSEPTSMVETRSQDQVSMDEGIAAEQIIVKITDKGYVTSHGDHYHFYTGEVPFDSIFLEGLVDQGETPQEEAIVSEVKDGWIIEDQGQFKVWLKKGLEAETVRTTEELTAQANGVDPKDARAISDIKGKLQVSEDALLIAKPDKTPKEVAQESDESSTHVVVYISEKHFVTTYGMDFYLFEGQVPKDIKFSDALLTAEDYQLNPKDIVSDIDGGHIVKVDDSYRVYLKQGNTAENVWNQKAIRQQLEGAYQAFTKSGKKWSQMDDAIVPGEVAGGSGSRNATGSYVTSDGYVFSPYDVIQDLGDGYIVPHGDHFHFIPKSDMTSQELAIAQSVLNGGKGKAQQGDSNQGNSHHKDSQSGNVIADQGGQKNSQGQYTTNDGYVFTVESIASVEDHGIVGAHGGHYHWVPFKDLSDAELKATQDYIAKKFGIHRNLLKEYHRLNPTPTPEQSSTTEAEITETTPSQPPVNRPQPEKDSDLAKLLKDYYALPKSQRYHEKDGLVFDPAKIDKVVTLHGKRAYVIPHGDHHHVIYEDQLSELEQRLARMMTEDQVVVTPGKPNPSPKEPTTDEPETTVEVTTEDPETTVEVTTEETTETSTTQEEMKVDLISKVAKHSAKGSDGQPYTTSDGYTFTPESIIQYDDQGILAEHHGHTHYVPYEDLEPSELQAAQDYINGQSTVDKVKDTQYSPEEVQAKLNFLAVQNGVAMSDLKVTGDHVIVPHGNHTHTIHMKDIPSELREADYDDHESYREAIMALKLSYVSRQYSAQHAIIDKDTVYIYLVDGQVIPMKLNDIHLPIAYEEVHFEAPEVEVTTEETTITETTQESTLSTESSISIDQLKTMIAKYYKIDKSTIQYFSGMFIIPQDHGENMVIRKEQALAFYKGELKELPPLQGQVTSSEMTEVSERMTTEVTTEESTTEVTTTEEAMTTETPVSSNDDKTTEKS